MPLYVRTVHRSSVHMYFKVECDMKIMNKLFIYIDFVYYIQNDVIFRRVSTQSRMKKEKNIK